MKDGSEVWWKEREEGWTEAGTVDDADSVFSAEGKNALVVVAGVLIGDRNSTEACFEEGWEGKKIHSRLVSLVAGQETDDICAC